MVPENTNDITDQNDVLHHDWCQVRVFCNVNCEIEHHNGQGLNNSDVQQWPQEDLGWHWLVQK